MSDAMQPEETDPPLADLPIPASAERNPQAADQLDELISRLEAAAEQLRSGDLSTDAAATLVEECAVLANRAGAELERRVHAPARGQGSLL
ncbi:MAG TPA: hypothetical protein VGL57_15105 [Solirubrobacteraceae bacterium]|jgi:hypothetical protein